MGRETPSPKDQGFLNNANRFRVSRDLTPPRQGMVDGHAVNIPQPGCYEIQRRRRSEASACRRNGTFNGKGVHGGGNAMAEAGKYTRPSGQVTATSGAGSRENPRGLVEYQSARTVNRHRWSGRIYQGARETHVQGTRQVGPVTSE